MENKKMIFGVMVLVLAVSIFLAGAYAAGVSSPIWPGSPQSVQPGEKGTIELTLQNMVGEEDITFRATVKQDDAGIITNKNKIEKDYLVPAGTKDTAIRVEYEIPETAEVGTDYTVILSFQEIGSDRVSGGVSMGIGMDTNLPFKVGPAGPEQVSEGMNKLTIFLIAIALIVIIVLIIFLVKKRNQIV
jgi:hypothetical protein